MVSFHSRQSFSVSFFHVCLGIVHELFCIEALRFLPVKNFQPCRDDFLSRTSTKQKTKCLAQVDNTEVSVSLKLTTP